MDVWFNLTRCSLVLYFIYISLKFNSGDLGILIMALLFLLCLNLSLYLIKKKSLRVLIAFLGILFAIFSGIYVSKDFYFFLPLQLLEACYIIDRKNNNLQLVILIPFAFAGFSGYGEIIIVTMLILIIYNCSNYYIDKLNTLSEKCDVLREENTRTLKASLEKETFKDQAVYLGQLEERNKIAQEIHDKIGHTISGSIMQLEAAKLIMEKEPAKSKDMISNSIEVLRQGLESIRETLRRIKPQRELLGLNRTKLIIEEFKNNTSMDTNFIFKGEVENINSEIWRVLIQNLTEGLTNVAKYSKGSKVSVTLEVLNKLIKLEIKDNGEGEKTIVKGLGLRGMEERTIELHGKLIIDGSDGFNVITLLPIS